MKHLTALRKMAVSGWASANFKNMSREEILTQCGVLNRELHKEDSSTIHLQVGKEKYDACLKAMEMYLIQELKSLRDACKQIHSEYVIERIEQEIDILENGF
jgi:hypothetical protein